MEHYDLAIIGSGSGNSLVTPDLAGWRVAIIEEGTFGGTCINVGCIPTKMYVYAADVADTVRDAKRFGIDASLDGVRWRDIRDRIYGRIDPISVSGREYRAHGANTVLYEAHAEFAAPGTLRLSTGEQVTADRIVVAAGSRPVIPPEVDGAPFHTSNTIMRIDELPSRLAILGGGFVAAEFAHVFSAFGTQVTVITRSDPLLRHLDLEIARLFTLIWRDQAGPPEACAEMRRILFTQVWRDRLRSGFDGGERIGAKTGTLWGIRNEAGVVEVPGRGRVAVAVFTRSLQPRWTEPAADHVIGTAGRIAVDALLH